MNIGSVRNSGVEIELNYTPIETNDLKWVINWNGTLMKNKILELHPDLKGEMINGSYIYREGESLYQFYLTKYAGVDHESGRLLITQTARPAVIFSPLFMEVSALHWIFTVSIFLSSVLIS